MSKEYEFGGLGHNGGYEVAVAKMAAEEIMDAYHKQSVKNLDSAILEAGYRPNTLVVRSIIDWLKKQTQ